MGGFFKSAACQCGCEKSRRARAALLAGLVFFLVANPKTYILMRRILGSTIATPNGNPTTLGLGVHAIVFVAVTWILMNIQTEGFEPAPSKAPAPAPAPADDEEEEEGEEMAMEEDEDDEEAQPGPAATGPAPSESDDQDEPAPANDDKADEPSAKRKAEKRIEDAWLYHAVDTGLRFGSFDRDMEIAGPAMTKKNAPMQCTCPDGSSVTVARK